MESSYGCRLGIARVPVNTEVRKSMMFSIVVVDITFPCGLSEFSQSCCKVSASLSDVGGLPVGAIDLIKGSLSVPQFVLVRNVG